MHSEHTRHILSRAWVSPLATKTRFRWYPTFDRMVFSPTC